MNKRLCIVMAIIFLINLVMIPIPVLANEEPTGYESKQLKVSGNKIVYLDNPETMVRLAGTNIPSLGWSKNGNGEHLVESLVETLDGWNANLIRLPVSPSMWFDQTVDSNQTETRSTIYKKNIDDMVRGAALRGKYLLLDCHTYIMPTEQVLDFWLDVCDVYGNNPAVLFGLCNEPHDIQGQEEDAGKSQWQLWRNGGKISYSGATVRGVGHQELVEAIRDKGIKNILVAAGLSWGYDLRGIAGLAGDGINYSLIDQGSNGDSSKTGYGIIYDSHIYPTKGLEPNWDATSGCVRSFAPILIGEFGWDTKDPNVSSGTSVFNLWMPQILDWMDDVSGKYGNVPANWTVWNMHMSSTPRAITGWDFNPTSFLGKYVKDRLLSYPPTSYPVTGEYDNTFSPDVFRSYTTNVTKNSSLSHSIQNNMLKLVYNRINGAIAVEKRMAFPIEWVFDGAQTIEFNLKANQEAVTTGTILEIGFEGTDQEIWTKQIPVQNTNDNRIVIPVNELRKLIMKPKGDHLLSNAIRAFYVGVQNTSKGELLIDNFKVTKSANPIIPMPERAIRIPNEPNYLFDMESQQGMLTVTKNDNGPGGSLGDYFRSEVLPGVGLNGSTALEVSYDRRLGIWGGYTYSKLPVGINCADAKYVSLCIRGDGKYQNLSPKIGHSTSMNVILEQDDTNWYQYTFKLGELGCELPEEIASIEFHANTKTEAVFWVDNIVVSDVPPPVFIEPKPIVFENGFEDSLLTCNMLSGSAGNSVTGQFIDGGYNSQRAYELTFNKTAGGMGATAEINHPSWNLEGTSLFTFDAKASGQTESIKVVLLDKVGVASTINQTFELTNEWQRFILPIENYMLNDYSILPSRIKGIHITNNKEQGASSILIDNITFSNFEVAHPVPHSVQYINSFDPDIYAQNGGIWQNIGDDGTAYIRAENTPGAGYQGTSGMVFQMKGTNTGRSIHMRGGFPADWDFNKAKYLSVMIKGTNVEQADGKMPNMNKLVMELWNDYTDTSGNAKSIKTGTVNLDATKGVWSNIIAPIEPNTKDKPSAELVSHTNRLVIYSTIAQTGGFIIDNLAFHDMKPVEVIPPEPVEFIETYDQNAVFSMSGGYYVNQSNYVYRNDKGGKRHWGVRVQYEFPQGAQPPTGSKYIAAKIPLSWRLMRTTHFVFDGIIIRSWVTSNFADIYNPLGPAITKSKVTISLVDLEGAEYKKVVELTNTAWENYQIPLNLFINDEGKALDLSTIQSVRLYPDEAGGQGGFDMDNIGFKTIVPEYNVSVSSISAAIGEQNMITNGLIAGTATVTANLSGTGKDVALLAAVYQKSGNVLSNININARDISQDGEQTSISVDIEIPNPSQEYSLKVFVWDRSYGALSPLSGGYIEIE